MDDMELDAEELLHLAGNLMARQQFTEALNFLQRAAQMEPGNAKVQLLLGGVHAKTGLIEPAIAATQRAAQLDPELHIAHFQLGFLLYAEDRQDEAIEAWKPLERLGENSPLVLFKRGMEALSREDFDACRDCLMRGIERNTPNGPLSAEMQQVIAWAAEAQKNAHAKEARNEPSVEPEAPPALSERPIERLVSPSKIPPLPEAFRRR